MNMVRLVPYVLAVIGLGAAANAFQLRLWAYGAPDAGLFPFLASILLVCASLVCTRDVLQAGDPIDVPRLLTYFASLAIFCLLLEVIGFALSAFLFLLVVLAAIERMDRKAAVVIAFSFSFCTWGLFEWLLSSPLPHGLWGV